MAKKSCYYQLNYQQQDLKKTPETQGSNLIEDKSNPVNLLWLSIREIEVVSFIHWSTKPVYKTFSLLLWDLDRFPGRLNFHISDITNPVLTLDIFSPHYIPDFYLSRFENCQQENLFKMI